MSDAPEPRQVEKKKHLAQVLARLRPGVHDPGARQGPPQGSGPPNRHGMPRLPVGQHEVKTWPRLDLGILPEVDPTTWRLRVDGLVERPLELDWAAFLALPQVEDVSDFHCVTTWSRMDNRWKGVRLSDLAQAAGLRPEARFVLFEAYDDYTTNLSLEAALAPDVLLVHEWEGAPLPHEHGGPVRVITPRLYAWKGAKWVRRVTFVAEDQPGFWEVRGYSNTADPWQDDRHAR